ncbi:flagellar filament capping protein FliD [Pluralibacter gergoviae]|uniref:flagellar filament capping protein FliD n=1 Tax=Pluralibacter gergoviae TaxID=61647 RepID=UPI000A3624E7|nr:flagellar filament capping protein FliD [Pluralibacter gergoviae]EKT9638642.1 flagellar filament capping protein FliD [Pluralibacter gergoviae]EKV3542524.1 flagellar filament capping protein FliD [Pluralibacter gergoviae]EKV9899068.1 flagellar filament capping protein FliD [Pluralibacter gergoviae]EKV9931528.1 flagellar filament capping protein FliD [Pluralibacter gergoviae]EKW9976394.1 flagellar filament capping protein FliD [Pluralibacter gergoviae]
MATISSLGAGTNLDLNTLYDNLQTAEQSKLTPITTQQTSYKAKLTAWSVVTTALNKFQTASDALKNTDSIASAKVSSTNTAFSATLANSATAGTYSVEVSQLASSQSLLSPKVNSKDKDLGDSDLASRTITISQPGQKTPMTVTLAQDKTSLADIRDAINKQQGSVTASIIKADDNSYYLSLTSKESGTTNQMTVSTDDSELAKYISYDAAGDKSTMSEQVSAADAVVKINGITITRSSNTITDAPEGITLTLNKTNAGTAETLTVVKDNKPMTDAVQAFVDAYNSLQTTIASQTKYTSVDKGASAQDTSNGDLVGDGTLRNIQTRLRSVITGSQPGAGSIQSLSMLGITQDVNGKLTVDSTKLNKALEEKSADVVTFLSGDGSKTGFATQTSALLTSMLANDGSVQNATDGINKTLKQLSDQYDTVNAQITSTMARYKTQFTSLSTLVSSLNQTSSYLTQQFNAMS